MSIREQLYTTDDGGGEQASLERGTTALHTASDGDEMRMREQLLGVAAGQHTQNSRPDIQPRLQSWGSSFSARSKEQEVSVCY